MLVAEAAQLLARLDVARLEELALSCQALNEDSSPELQQALRDGSRSAARDMALLAKLLESTRANAAVMARLRKMHENRMEYAADLGSQRSEPEVSRGHN